MFFKQIFDKKLAQYSYLIGCQASGEAIVIDPLRDIDLYDELATEENLKITAAVDTHIHADYVSGLREFAEKGVIVYASDEGGTDWKYEWLKDSDYSYHLLKDGDDFSIGNIRFDVLHTPGHTPESLSFLVTDGAATDEPLGILTGDFVFVGDIGRPDLLETAAGQTGTMTPAAQTLFRSVEDFKNLPEYLQLWPGHGAGSACGKALGAVPVSTVGYELRFSPAFKAADSEQQFVDFILDGQPEPPLYFGRMKTVNREGPAVLGEIKKPPRISLDEVQREKGIVIDTRERHDYMKGHLPGSILASYGKNFNTIAGSYVDPDRGIYLIIEEDRAEQAYRDLIRVGLDRIRGYITPSDLEAYSGELQQVEAVDFGYVLRHYQDGNRQVLDVRSGSEYDEEHIPGALNIPHTRLAECLNLVPEEKELIIHCGSGQRASYAAGLLGSMGRRMKWVDDNYENWQQMVQEKDR